MSNVHHNNEDEHFPCSCHRPEYAYTDSLCPECEDAAEREREETMSPDDWDADNDWLASAGWGEM